MSVNKAIILGNVGKDPEFATTKSGTSVCKLSIATSNKWTGKDGTKHDETTWHNVVVWGKQAEVVHQYFHKGDQIFVEGRIENRSYEKDGQKKYISEIVMEKFSFVGSKKDQEQSKPVDNSMDGSAGFDESSLPF